MITRRPWIAGLLGGLVAALLVAIAPPASGVPLVQASGPKLFTSGGGGGGGPTGNLVAYSALNATTGNLETLDGSLGGVPLWNANCTWGASSGVGGRGGWECVPPTAGAAGGSLYSAIGQLNLKNGGGSANIQRLYVRFYMRFGPDWAANNTFDAVKFAIFWAQPGPVRPMIYCDARNGALGIAPTNSVVCSPAQGTTRYFSEIYPSGATGGVFDGNNRFDFYYGQSAGSTSSPAKPILAPSTWTCYELLFDSTQVNGNANGLIRMRVTNPAGTILSDLDESMRWDHESGVAFNGSLDTIDVLGGYYNGYTTTPGANNYVRVDGRISFQMNATTFAGCESAFLTGDAQAMPRSWLERAANDDAQDLRLAA